VEKDPATLLPMTVPFEPFDIETSQKTTMAGSKFKAEHKSIIQT
jgi:hypothetical protein